MSFGLQVLLRCFYSVLVLLLCITAVAAQQTTGLGAQTKPFTVIYKLKPSAGGSTFRMADSGEALQKAIQKLGSEKPVQKFPGIRSAANARMSGPSGISLIYELQHDPEIPFEQVKRMLLATGQVAYVEPVYLREPLHQPNDADSTTSKQYYLKLIQAYSGWEAEKGNTAVVIGILDTGFRLEHPDLKDKVALNEKDPVDGLDNDQDGYTDNYAGWDYADHDNDVADNTRYVNHGTAVAGVAAANTNNGFGMAGVGYNLKFMPIKVFTKEGNFNGGYEAIVYAAEMGCKVINLSWGGEYFSQYEQDIINYVVLEKDVAIIASAGNTNRKADMYPASYEHVISVGGTTEQDLKVPEHTYSYKIDVAAPSRNVYTTYNNSYTTTSGTSFGSPMVAACAALVRSKYPQLNALQVMEQVRVASDNIYHLSGNASYNEMLGKGRLNVKRALKEENLRSVRCTSFNTEMDRPLQSGATTAIVASFTNYLAATQNLQVILTSPSPYVSITQESFNLGSLATSGTASNTERPFKVTVSADAPQNLIVPFRIGYTDGPYTDFQYFELMINPDYLTLATENLKLTFNGKGNIGYNGLNLSQGVGFTYKESSSLLFEGGLIVAASPEKVSDNLHNSSWKNDENLTPISPARLRYNTKLADQDLKGAMQDKFPNPGNAGVAIKYKAYSWNTIGNQNFIVVEYQIRNTTSDTIPVLHAGLFADWDIGKFNENTAGWDAVNKLGYAFNKDGDLPYTGVKLLTDDLPSYFAFDNASINIEDGFSDEEKYKALASGVTNYQAGMNGKGSNIAHVLGVATKNLAPGEVKTIAFAVLAADNLSNLQRHAEAAQKQYISIKSGPAPTAHQDTACVGGIATWAPQGGTNFKFYADAEKNELLGSGTSYTVENFAGPLTIYAASIDSLFEGGTGAALFSLPRTPEVDFTFTPGPVYPGSRILFENKSTYGKNFTWSTTDVKGKTFTGDSIIYAFSVPGTYEVTLTASDNHDCITSSETKTVKVLHSSPAVLEEVLALYPVPAQGRINVTLLPDGASDVFPEVALINVLGKTFKPKVDVQNSMEATLHLDGLAPGVYFAQFTYKHVRILRRIIVL